MALCLCWCFRLPGIWHCVFTKVSDFLWYDNMSLLKVSECDMALSLYCSFTEICCLHLQDLHRNSITWVKSWIFMNTTVRTSNLILNLKCEKWERLWTKICIREFRQEEAREGSHHTDGCVHGGDIWQRNWTISWEMSLQPCLAACLLNGRCYHHVTATEHEKYL